jgi:hypothetical protein
MTGISRASGPVIIIDSIIKLLKYYFSRISYYNKFNNNHQGGTPCWGEFT